LLQGRATFAEKNPARDRCPQMEKGKMWGCNWWNICSFLKLMILAKLSREGKEIGSRGDPEREVRIGGKDLPGKVCERGSWSFKTGGVGKHEGRPPLPLEQEKGRIKVCARKNCFAGEEELSFPVGKKP